MQARRNHITLHHSPSHTTNSLLHGSGRRKCTKEDAKPCRSHSQLEAASMHVLPQGTCRSSMGRRGTHQRQSRGTRTHARHDSRFREMFIPVCLTIASSIFRRCVSTTSTASPQRPLSRPTGPPEPSISDSAGKVGASRRTFLAPQIGPRI